jgi:hypothetical protein
MAIDYSRLPKDAFTCPKCGGSHYGKPLHGTVHCHDQFETNCRWNGPPDECMYASDEAKLELAEEMLEKAEAKLDVLMRVGTPWPLRDVLKKLADAADHLLSNHDCDLHGYEEVSHARDVAKLIIEAL